MGASVRLGPPARTHTARYYAWQLSVAVVTGSLVTLAARAFAGGKGSVLARAVVEAPYTATMVVITGMMWFRMLPSALRRKRAQDQVVAIAIPAFLTLGLECAKVFTSPRSIHDIYNGGISSPWYKAVYALNACNMIAWTTILLPSILLRGQPSAPAACVRSLPSATWATRTGFAAGIAANWMSWVALVANNFGFPLLLDVSAVTGFVLAACAVLPPFRALRAAPPFERLAPAAAQYGTMCLMVIVASGGGLSVASLMLRLMQQVSERGQLLVALAFSVLVDLVRRLWILVVDMAGVSGATSTVFVMQMLESVFGEVFFLQLDPLSTGFAALAVFETLRGTLLSSGIGPRMARRAVGRGYRGAAASGSRALPLLAALRVVVGVDEEDPSLSAPRLLCEAQQLLALWQRVELHILAELLAVVAVPAALVTEDLGARAGFGADGLTHGTCPSLRLRPLPGYGLMLVLSLSQIAVVRRLLSRELLRFRATVRSRRMAPVVRELDALLARRAAAATSARGAQGSIGGVIAGMRGLAQLGPHSGSPGSFKAKRSVHNAGDDRVHSFSNPLHPLYGGARGNNGGGSATPVAARSGHNSGSCVAPEGAAEDRTRPLELPEAAHARAAAALGRERRRSSPEAGAGGSKRPSALHGRRASQVRSMELVASSWSMDTSLDEFRRENLAWTSIVVAFTVLVSVWEAALVRQRLYGPDPEITCP